MFPALAVYTPSARRSGGSARMALSAPRILNEPIGWSVSNFSQISHGASTCRRTSGVRKAVPAIRSRAAWNSESAMGAIGARTGAFDVMSKNCGVLIRERLLVAIENIRGMAQEMD